MADLDDDARAETGPLHIDSFVAERARVEDCRRSGSGTPSGDAVTNTALALRALVRRLGPSEVFANHVDGEMVGDAPSGQPRRGRRMHLAQPVAAA